MYDLKKFEKAIQKNIIEDKNVIPIEKLEKEKELINRFEDIINILMSEIAGNYLCLNEDVLKMFDNFTYDELKLFVTDSLLLMSYLNRYLGRGDDIDVDKTIYLKRYFYNSLMDKFKRIKSKDIVTDDFF